MDEKFFISRLENMSEEQFQKAKLTDEYRAANANPAIKAEMIAMLGRRRSNEKKREKILEALYGNPQALGWIRDMEDYRRLRIKQAWISMVTNGEIRDAATISDCESLERQRRGLHNKALAAFCRLIESTSPLSNRSNTPQKDEVFFPREARNGDLYEGPLMIPFEEEDNYGNHAVRGEMTTGMFQFLKFIAETPRGDWDILRNRVIDKVRASGRLAIDKKNNLPNVEELQTDLRRLPSLYRMSEAPTEDDFGLELFDEKDRKYGKKSVSRDEI